MVIRPQSRPQVSKFLTTDLEMNTAYGEYPGREKKPFSTFRTNSFNIAHPMSQQGPQTALTHAVQTFTTIPA